VSHGARRDTEVNLMLLAAEPRLVRIEGAQIKRLNPDERSTLALVSKALENLDVGAHETVGPPGIWTSRRDLETVLGFAKEAGDVVWLRENATTPLEAYVPSSPNVAFVLSDHRDPSEKEVETMARYATHEVTLGPLALQADQCITLAQHRLDQLRHPNL
jgi:tRNA (pseudouridine54-N1)-methyltransferase